MRHIPSDFAPCQLNMGAPKKTSPGTPSEGQFTWHQSRTAEVLYFTNLLTWALSKSALSATTDASTAQQVLHEYKTASRICRLPPRTVITGARVTAQQRFSILWRNFSRRASCHFIRCPHVLGQTWRTCSRDSTRQHASHLLSTSGLTRAALSLVDQPLFVRHECN